MGREWPKVHVQSVCPTVTIVARLEHHRSGAQEDDGHGVGVLLRLVQLVHQEEWSGVVLVVEHLLKHFEVVEPLRPPHLLCEHQEGLPILGAQQSVLDGQKELS